VILLYNGGMKKKALIIISIILVLTITAIVGTTVGLSNTVGELKTEISRSPVDAILANANVEDEAVVMVPILYYDQVMDECVNLYDVGMTDALETRQFEWAGCGYYNGALEQGMTETELDSNYLPVARGGNMLPNRGVKADSFTRWFNAVEGASQIYGENLSLRYDASTASFTYENENFYPLNNIVVPDEPVNKDGNNHLFTLNLGVPVQIIADGNEMFSVTADDDTWVYVGDRLVLDMGGIHEAMAGRFKITAEGEIYTAIGEEDLAYSGVKASANTGSIVRIFHADRNSESSVFRVSFSNMLLNVTDDTTLARGTNTGVVDGTTVAYNPEDPGYAAPLGESLTYQPNRSRVVLASAIVQALVLGVLSVALVASISVVWRYGRRDHSREE